jgi:hypothetical protein
MSTALPPGARAKLTRLRAHSGDLSALARSAGERVADLERRIANGERAVAGMNPENPAREESERALAALRKELDAAVAEASKRDSAWRAALEPVKRVELHLSKNGRRRFTDAAPAEAEPDGEPLPDALAAVRADVARIKSERDGAASAPPIAVERKAQVTEIVQRLVDAGRPELKVDRGALAVRWPAVSNYTVPPAPLHVCALAWLDPEAMVAALLRDAGTLPALGRALAQSDREARVRKLTAELFEAERREEAHVEAALAAGLPGISRRKDADPCAILGLCVSEAEQAA